MLKNISIIFKNIVKFIKKMFSNEMTMEANNNKIIKNRIKNVKKSDINIANNIDGDINDTNK